MGSRTLRHTSKARMLVLKQPGDDIRAAALGDLDGDQ